MSPNKPVHDAVQDKAILGLNDMDAKGAVDAVASRRSDSPDVPTTEPDGVKSTLTGILNGLRSSPPTFSINTAMDIDPPRGSGTDVVDKSDSEAETIVLPGKDGHSPSKIRKSIKHEDRSEDEEMKGAPNSRDVDADGDIDLEDVPNPSESTKVASTLGKRKRPKHGVANDENTHLGNSSGLSSVPTSPVTTARSSLSKPAASDSEISKSPSPRSRSRSAVRDQVKSVDRGFPRRKQYGSGSGDEGETGSLGFRKQRNSGGDHKSNRDSRLTKHNAETSPRKRTRSTSPHGRSHKRSVSNQLPSKSSHGLSHKKKRVPAPLQSTEYHSDESSASGNSHPRSSRLRSLAAPTTGESTISPAKMPPHKKHVNSSGQTQLAIACNRGRLDAVKQRYEDRPEDINVPDHALNTPLHIASLAGCADIVKFLIDTGDCELNPINLERDTPLHDAVDNKHVKVVKLLLDAGANPSIANKNQNEPLELLDLMLDQLDQDEEDEEDDEKEREAIKVKIAEMRKAITAAKRKFVDARRGSEDHQTHDHGEGRESHPKESPRQTTPAHELLASGPSNRRQTARSMMKTKERNLWMGYTVEELRAAATEGDVEFTNQFLNVKSDVNDPRTLYNAARGGNDAIINLLFALGNFNPDPAPLDGLPHDQATPILATIGKDEHLEVLKLFIGNADFDPTRRIKGETYFEIAKRRAGPKWREEEQLLKDAFDTYQKNRKPSPSKSRSPGLRRVGREADRDAKKSVRSDDTQAPRSHKRTTSSPKTKDSDLSKTQHRNSSSVGQSKDGAKRGPGRPKKEESSTSNALSDRETSPLGPPKQKSQVKRYESDLNLPSESEPAAKPRRKLVSGRELRDERELEKQRRASVASNASTTSLKDKRERGPHDSKSDRSDGKASPNFPRIPKSSNEREPATEKQSSDKDRARSLKRDDSKDRLSAIRSESPVKRPRSSATPPRSGMQEVSAAYDSSEIPHKRRKLDGESNGHKADSTSSSSPEHRTAVAKSGGSNEKHKAATDPKNKSRTVQKQSELRDVKDASSIDKISPNRPAKSKTLSSSSDLAAKRPKATNDRQSEDTAGAHSISAYSDEEAQRQAQIRRQRKEAEALRLKEVEDEKEREREREKEKEREKEREREREKERERELEREREQERIELAKQARLAREQAEREEQEKREREEAERKERQRIADAEAEARAKEKERLRYEEQERLKHEELERRRAAHAEQQRAERARIEKEKREERLSKLPLLLKWFDMVNEPKSPEVANLFKTIIGYRYDTIKPETQGHPSGREQWMLNTHAALLLGEKDLQLSRYTAWDRVHLSLPQKSGVWMNNSNDGLYSLYSPPLSSLRKQLPSNNEPGYILVEKNKHLFLDLNLFFVKVSEFMFIVPNFPHLRNIELEVKYQELREPQSRLDLGRPLNQMRWKSDPETAPDQTWAPKSKFYLNGEFIRQGEVPRSRILKEPPPPDNFPRREGITRVHEDDPDYEEQCKKQGLYDRLPGYPSASPVSSNNPHLGDLENHNERLNGITPPMSDKSKSVNGGSPHRTSLSESVTSQNLPNGTNAGDFSPTATTS